MAVNSLWTDVKIRVEVVAERIKDRREVAEFVIS